MRERFRNWMRTPSLRGQLIWLSVSSVLVTLLISLLILVLLISNVMGPFVNREAEFAMQTVSRSLSTKTQLLEDILLRICKSPQMTGEASDARGEQFRSLVDIYSDKNIVAPGLPFVEMAYFMDMHGAFDVVSYHEPKEIRQVISQETSDMVRSYMESVVNDVGGTGKNAKVAGYRIGGKTGSSQTLDSEDHIIVSFLGFAPADDPEVIVLLGYDWPQPSAPGQNTTKDGTYISGGNMAAPMAGELIANILDYLGYQKSGNTVNENGVTIPNVVGQTPDEARAALNALGLNVRTSGEGSVVTDQMPTAGSTVPKGSSTVLYLGEEKPKETVAMPDLSGMTYDEAKKALEDVGLYLNATGSGTSGTVFEQLVLPGTPVELGATVEVKFAENTEPDNGLSSANGDWAEDPEEKDQTQPQTGN